MLSRSKVAYFKLLGFRLHDVTGDKITETARQGLSTSRRRGRRRCLSIHPFCTLLVAKGGKNY